MSEYVFSLCKSPLLKILPGQAIQTNYRLRPIGFLCQFFPDVLNPLLQHAHPVEICQVLIQRDHLLQAGEPFQICLIRARFIDRKGPFIK